MLVGGGPWLGVLGGVFTDKVIVQRLTDFMWCAHSTTEEDPRVYRLARVLVALRRSIHELENFYKDIRRTSGYWKLARITHSSKCRCTYLM